MRMKAMLTALFCGQDRNMSAEITHLGVPLVVAKVHMMKIDVLVLIGHGNTESRSAHLQKNVDCRCEGLP